MELKDALLPFFPAGMSAQRDYANAHSDTRVAFLSERLDLKAAMRRALPTDRFTLTQACSIGLVEKAIEQRICDVAIVDVERRDERPNSVFSRFDNAAAGFPVIILCKRRHEILDYLWRAQHVIDIVAYETIGDPRFVNLIEAAMLRAELTDNISVGDNGARTPPSAA